MSSLSFPKRMSFYRIFVALMLLAMLVSACAPAATPAPAPAPTAAALEPTDVPAVPTAAPVQPTQAVAEATAVPAGGAACPSSTVADPKGLKSAWPQQFELDEFDKAANCTLKFTDNPLFAADVQAGKLPTVDKRLPDEPLVVEPYAEIGKYGGRLRSISIAPESGTAETLSWRHVNLVRYLDDLQTIVPNVAKAWKWNDTFTELTFTLRKGHKWSDGEPFTTDDIMFWYKDIHLNQDLFPDNSGVLKYGGVEYKIEKIDDLNFKYVFQAPAPGFLSYLAVAYTQPWQPKHFFEKYHIAYNPDANAVAAKDGYKTWVDEFRSFYNDWKDSYHRTGVPVLESHYLADENTDHRLVKANPYYFKVDTAGQQLPYIDEQYESFISDKEMINLKIVAGEVDLKGDALDLMSYPVYKENEAAGNYTVQLPPAGLGAGMHYVFNTTHKDPVLRALFLNPKFTQAMSIAINRDEINQTVYLGLAKPIAGLPADPLSNPFVTADQASYNTQYDVDKANSLLDDLGLKKGADGMRLRSDGKPLSLLLEYAPQGGPALVHELVKGYWEAVGVKVELKEESTEAFRQHSLTNDLDVYNWKNDGTAGPAMIASANLFWPFQGGLVRTTGTLWMDWFDSNGAKGVEPPDWAKQLKDLASQWSSMQPGTKEWTDLGTKMTQIYIENMPDIGTVGYVPAPVIVNNRLGNVPQWKIQVYDYYFHYPYRVDQFFIKQ
jgi:peptide/nickel transport system substrate-binding protein